MQMTVFSGKCQWQLDHFLICIPKASGLSGNHISQAGTFLVGTVVNLSYQCQSIMVLKTERAFICKAEDNERQSLAQQKSGTRKEMKRRVSGDREGLGIRSEMGYRHGYGSHWLFGGLEG